MKLKCRKELDYLVRRCRRVVMDAKSGASGPGSVVAVTARTKKAQKKCAAWIERQKPVVAEKPDGAKVLVQPRLDGWELRLDVSPA